MTTAILALQSLRRWDPVDAPLRSEPGARSRAQLALVLAQFCVATNPRYQKTWNPKTQRWETWCNVLTWDATRALGCEVPHWVSREVAQGLRLEVDARVRYELDANHTIAWLSGPGFAEGWSACTPASARELARQGCPVVACYRAPVGSGHVAMVHPSPDDEPALLITQAGNVCLEAVPVSKGFGDRPVHFFSHP